MAKIDANSVKKELYKSRVNAKLTHYRKGNLYYTIELEDGTYEFPISTIETTKIDVPEIGLKCDIVSLSHDLGETPFDSEIKASELNRWIAKAIEADEFNLVS